MSAQETTVRAAVSALNTAADHLGKSRKRQRPTRVTMEAHRPRYVAAILAQDWQHLAGLGGRITRERAVVNTRIRQDLSEAVLAAEAVARAAAASNLVGSAVRMLSATFLDLLRARLRAKGRRKPKIEAILAPLASMTLAKTVASIDRSVAAQLDELDRIARRHLRAVTGALFASAAGNFNSLRTPPTKAAEVSKAAQTARNDLAALRRSVYEALRAGDGDAAAIRASELGSTGREILKGRILSDAASLSATLARSPAEIRAAIECGDGIRDCLLAMAESLRLTWLLRFPASHPQTAAWFQAAQTLRFSKPHRVDRATISELSGAGGGHDGVMVTVTGILGPVTIQHRARKVISSAPIRDAAGRQIVVILPHIKLDSGGMVSGAVVKVTGVWRRSSAESSGPALHIDRVHYANGAKESFEGWVRRELRPFFEASPHGLNASWSWERGTDGAANPLRYGTWHGGRK